MNTCVLKDLEMQTIAKIAVGDTEVIFELENGKRYAMWHHQDCCEHVRLIDVVGDIDDLIGVPLAVAEESSGETPPDLADSHSPSESYTWTFYRFGTRKGWVTFRWLGESNGYYGESVDFEEITLRS